MELVFGSDRRSDVCSGELRGKTHQEMLVEKRHPEVAIQERAPNQYISTVYMTTFVHTSSEE